MTQTITITGMTCQKCVSHVSQALKGVPGVRSVEIELHDGTARISADRNLSRDEITAALDEAGYTVG